MRFQSNKQLGLSLLETLVAVGIVGVVAVVTLQIFGNAYQNSRNAKEQIDRTSIASYVLQFTDCAKTRADPGFAAACASGQTVNLRDKRDQIIVSRTGRKFANLTAQATCNGTNIQLAAKSDTDANFEPLLSGVPIICPVAAPLPDADIVATHMGTGFVKCAWRTELSVNNGPWIRVGGNRFIGSRTVKITDAMGFNANPFCNVIRARAVGTTAGFDDYCAGRVLILPGGGCGRKPSTGYKAPSGTTLFANQDDICEGNTDIHTRIFIDPTKFRYQVQGIAGMGSCI